MIVVLTAHRRNRILVSKREVAEVSQKLRERGVIDLTNHEFHIVLAAVEKMAGSFEVTFSSSSAQQ
jgi:hypothetical protein